MHFFVMYVFWSDVCALKPVRLSLSVYLSTSFSVCILPSLIYLIAYARPLKLSVCLPVCLPTCLSAYLSVCLPVCLSFSLCTCLFCLPLLTKCQLMFETCIAVCLSVCLCAMICLPLPNSICLSYVSLRAFV